MHKGENQSDKAISKMEASFKLRLKYSVASFLFQKQRLADWLLCALANLDSLLVKDDVSKIKFDNNSILTISSAVSHSNVVKVQWRRLSILVILA